MQDGEMVTERFRQNAHSQADADLRQDAIVTTDLLAQVSQLEAKAKVALVRELIAQLGTNEIPAILEFGLREIGDRHRRRHKTSVNHHTRLLLKKDYSYQSRGLSEPTQYYVYLRRRKPKLDRYIGTLFYIPKGCKLSYFLDESGRIIFNSPQNVFQLRDYQNPAIVQIVRLICLEPPPPDYTFSKQQNDIPEIHLHLEYLDVKTYQFIAKQTYPFPVCMHEGGRLDRYRWEVSALSPAALSSAQIYPPEPLSVAEPIAQTCLIPTALAAPIEDSSIPLVNRAGHQLQNASTIEGLTFNLANQADAETVLNRLRLWVDWSYQAMPQTAWELRQAGADWLLMDARSQRIILKFEPDQTRITMEQNLTIVMKWFHDLSLAVSQIQTSKHAASKHCAIAQNLLVEMNLPQSDPTRVLSQIFEVEFLYNSQR